MSSVTPVSMAAPQRLHPLSVVFQLLTMIRQQLFPAFVAGYSAVNGSLIGLLIAGGLFGVILFFTLVRYFTFRYRITDGELVVTEGLLFRKVRTVPVDRIQNVDLVQSVLHRIFGVAEVRVETASGTKPEATLRVLSLADVDRLRAAVSMRGKRTSTVDEPSQPMEPETQDTAAAKAARTILTIPSSWLVKAGLASNRGLILVSVILGYVFQQDRRISDQFEEMARYVPREGWLGGPYVSALIAIVLVLAIIRCLGVAWYVLRFWGYRLDRVDEDFHISCGLLTRVSATVPRRRIQFVSIHRSPLMRWMKLASVRIETAGGAGKQGEDAATTVTRRWFVPVIPESEVAALVAELRDGLSMDEASVCWQTAAPKAGRRLIRLSLILGLIAGGIGYASAGPAGIGAGVVVLVLHLIWSRRHLRVLGIAELPNGMLFRSGVWNRKTSATFFDRVQTVELNQSWFDRRWSMAGLSLDTAAAGPADHPVRMSMMDSDQADATYALVSKRCAESPMVWN